MAAGRAQLDDGCIQEDRFKNRSSAGHAHVSLSNNVLQSSLRQFVDTVGRALKALLRVHCKKRGGIDEL